MQWLTDLWSWLASVHPALPWALIPALCWVSVGATRRWVPSVWAFLEKLGPAGKLASKAWQASPSVLLGAFLGAFSGGTGDYRGAILGALAGPLAPVWHEALATWAQVRLATPQRFESTGQTISVSAPGFVGNIDVAASSGPISPTPQPGESVLRGPSPPGAATLLLLAGLVTLGEPACTPEAQAKACSPDAQKWAKRSAASGIILAGECDEGKVADCDALEKADLAADAYRAACQTAGVP